MVPGTLVIAVWFLSISQLCSLPCDFILKKLKDGPSSPVLNRLASPKVSPSPRVIFIGPSLTNY